LTVPEFIKQIKDEDKITLLIESLRTLDLIPKTGHGEVILVFQDGYLLFTEHLTKTKIKTKI
jgi:hypothetical protein